VARAGPLGRPASLQARIASAACTAGAADERQSVSAAARITWLRGRIGGGYQTDDGGAKRSRPRSRRTAK